MKQAFLIVAVFLFLNATAQPKDRQIIGYWKLEKMVISPEMFFDLSDQDSTRRNFLKQYKEKSFGSSWTLQDSATAQMLYQKAIIDMGQMFLHIKSDAFFTTNGYNRREGKISGTETGTYKFNVKKMELIMVENNTPNELLVLALNDSTLTVVGKDKSVTSPTLTYKKM